MYCIDTEYDYLNSQGLRNVDNTDVDDYNCGGYALNTFSWYMPYEGETEDQEFKVSDMIEADFSLEEIYEILLSDYTSYMLNEIEGLRLLTDPTEVKKNERLIYFRIFVDLIGYDSETEYYDDVHFDFHYRYFENGHWYEKCGGDDLRTCDEDMESDWECGYNVYDSRTVYLALEI